MDPSRNNMYRRMVRYDFEAFNVSPSLTKPPAQDSANNILNALTDECIQRVLTHLIGDIRDFLSAAEVCKKFQENAKTCFPSIYREFFIGHGLYDELPQCRLKSFLSIFGHLLHSVYWYEGDRFNDSETIKDIANFCGKNLFSLDIQRHDFDFSVATQFERIEELRLCGCTLNNFKIPPNLKNLRLLNSKVNLMDWISETHPNLIKIQYYNNNIDALNDEMVIKFQALNPQIQSFQFEAYYLTSSVLQGIATRLPNLVDLTFSYPFDRKKIDLQQKFEADVMHLSELRYLKRLTDIGVHQISTCPIVDAFADKNVPIEELVIDGHNPRIVESLARLSSLKVLTFFACNQEMAIDIIKKMPNLEQLHIHHCAEISLNGIRQMLELKTNLKKLSVFDRNLVIDSLDLTESILNLARDRVEVRLEAGFSNIKVPIKKYQIEWFFCIEMNPILWLQIYGRKMS